MTIVKDVIRAVILGSILSLLVYFAFAQTWTEPTVAPPGGNRPAPLILDNQGNLSLPSDLSIGGNFKFKLGGIDVSPVLLNGSEDTYPGNQGWVGYTWGDTCNGSVNSPYSCQPTEARTCRDLWDVCVCCPWCGGRAHRYVTCRLGVEWQSQ